MVFFAISHSLCTACSSAVASFNANVNALWQASNRSGHRCFGGAAVMALTALLALLYSPREE